MKNTFKDSHIHNFLENNELDFNLADIVRAGVFYWAKDADFYCCKSEIFVYMFESKEGTYIVEQDDVSTEYFLCEGDISNNMEDYNVEYCSFYYIERK